MVDTTQPAPEGRQLVQSYRAGEFTIAGLVHRGSILLLPERALAWSVSEAGQITADSLAELRHASSEIEILIVGMGAKFAMLPPSLRAELKGWGVVAESMATPAACRTYNLLASEGRRVAAALIAV
jgi:uncharacterized protein